MQPVVVPMLAYEDPGAALDWLASVFGFREIRRMVMPDGRIGHAEMEAGDGGLIMLATPSPDYESPRSHRRHCPRADRWLSVPYVVDGVLVHVDDLDAHYRQANAAGAIMLSGVEDEPYGRLYRAEDIEGHRWMFMQPAPQAEGSQRPDWVPPGREGS
ncbi:MAG TPA: VOC family protein [Chloroflexota bacterium]|nr:VOC family protein [Chloroflexota bacterium]